MGEQKGEILFSGVRPTKAFLKRYTGAQLSTHPSCHRGVCFCNVVPMGAAVAGVRVLAEVWPPVRASRPMSNHQ